MATEAQIRANCENAQASTGPQTREGKHHSSGNSLKFGLFSTKNCVLPGETDEYSDLSRGLWESLSPLGPVEEMFAAEIVRHAWRLRRCAATEAILADQAIEATLSGGETLPVLDPICNDAGAAIQAAVDRARTQATGALQRAMAELRRLQTERWARRESLPAGFDASTLGIASSKRVIETLLLDSNRRLASGKVEGNENLWAALRTPSPLLSKQNDAAAKRTRSGVVEPESVPRNAPCPCGSGLKYKRCCGKTAPVVLHAAA